MATAVCSALSFSEARPTVPATYVRPVSSRTAAPSGTPLRARAERARVTILRSSGSSALLSVMGRAYVCSGTVEAEAFGARQTRHHQVVRVLDELPDQLVREVAVDRDGVPVTLVHVVAGDDQ